MDPGAAQDLIPRYHQALDFEALWREFPPPPDYFSATYRLSRDEMRGMQEQRFLRQMERAWQVPFYRLQRDVGFVIASGRHDQLNGQVGVVEHSHGVHQIVDALTADD